jgi:hypothetical protein
MLRAAALCLIPLLLLPLPFSLLLLLATCTELPLMGSRTGSRTAATAAVEFMTGRLLLLLVLLSPGATLVACAVPALLLLVAVDTVEVGTMIGTAAVLVGAAVVVVLVL